MKTSQSEPKNTPSISHAEQTHSTTDPNCLEASRRDLSSTTCYMHQRYLTKFVEFASTQDSSFHGQDLYTDTHAWKFVTGSIVKQYHTFLRTKQLWFFGNSGDTPIYRLEGKIEIFKPREEKCLYRQSLKLVYP